MRSQKTNAMRELEAAGIAFEVYSYEETQELEEEGHNLGVLIAQRLGQDPDAAFKTLVLKAASGSYVVACIPVADELDLKKAAAAAGEKHLSLVPVKDIETVTGYVRGGCSPVGMKKHFCTLIDETAQLFERISISGGRRGLSLELDPLALAAHVEAHFADLVRG